MRRFYFSSWFCGCTADVSGDSEILPFVVSGEPVRPICSKRTECSPPSEVSFEFVPL